jgi:TonB family protein
MVPRLSLITAVFICFFITSTSAQEQTRNAPALISQKVADAFLLTKVEPNYSDTVKSMNTSGQAVIAFTIDKTGNVTHAMVVERDLAGNKSSNIGDPHLRQTVLDAVKQRKYRPYLLKGEPTEVDTSVVLLYNFSYPNASSPRSGVVTAAATGAPSAANGGKLSSGQFGKPLIDPKVAEKNLTGKVEPQYPEMAKIAHIQGDVVVHVLIDKAGHVANVKATSGHPILIQAALSAVKQWDYKPFLLNGEPAEIETSVLLRFRP